MDGWLDFTRLELASLQERADALAPKTDPDGDREWSLLRDTSGEWYLRVAGSGSLYKLDGPSGDYVTRITAGAAAGAWSGKV